MSVPRPADACAGRTETTGQRLRVPARRAPPRPSRWSGWRATTTAYPVDLVIVGAGAGGGDARAAARAARMAGRRASTPGRSGTRTATGSPTRRGSHKLYWTEPRVIGGERPGRAGQEQLRPRRRRLDGPLRRLHAALSPLATSRCARATASARTGRSPTATCKPPLRADRAELPVAGRGLAVGRPAPLPARRRTRSAATGPSLPARGARALGIETRVGPVAITNGTLRQPAALHLPRLLPAGLQGQRQGLAADHPHSRRARARRGDPRRTAWQRASRSTTSPGA